MTFEFDGSVESEMTTAQVADAIREALYRINIRHTIITLKVTPVQR